MLSPGSSSTDGCAERIAHGSTDGATDGSLVGDEGLAVGLADGALGPVSIHTHTPVSYISCSHAFLCLHLLVDGPLVGREL